MDCRECGFQLSHPKKWGYANVCEICDDEEKITKSMGIMIADGKTDYHVEVVRNPSPNDIKMIQRIGRAWDPRSQMSTINKVSS